MAPKQKPDQAKEPKKEDVKGGKKKPEAKKAEAKKAAKPEAKKAAKPEAKKAAKPEAKKAAKPETKKAAKPETKKAAKPKAKKEAKNGAKDATKKKPAAKKTESKKPPQWPGVFIKHLEFEGMNKGAVRNIFKHVKRDIREVRVRHNRYVMVFVKDEEAQKKLLDYDGKAVHGCNIQVQAIRRAKPFRPRRQYCKTLYIAGLPGRPVARHLFKHFRAAGKILKVRVYRRPKPHAFVYFRDNASALRGLRFAKRRYYYGRNFRKEGVKVRFTWKLEAKLSIRTVELDKKRWLRRYYRAPPSVIKRREQKTLERQKRNIAKLRAKGLPEQEIRKRYPNIFLSRTKKRAAIKEANLKIKRERAEKRGKTLKEAKPAAKQAKQAKAPAKKAEKPKEAKPAPKKDQKPKEAKPAGKKGEQGKPAKPEGKKGQQPKEAKPQAKKEDKPKDAQPVPKKAAKPEGKAAKPPAKKDQPKEAKPQPKKEQQPKPAAKPKAEKK